MHPQRATFEDGSFGVEAGIAEMFDRMQTGRLKVFAHLKPQTPTPDLVVYLQAPVDTLVERVHRRGIDFEQSMPAEYLARLADAYTRFFYRYEEAPLLIVNSERLNFVDDSAHVDLLLARVGTMRSQREFFNLGPA
jgi:deoxyadenosine/deoxycytidine kinase